MLLKKESGRILIGCFVLFLLSFFILGKSRAFIHLLKLYKWLFLFTSFKNHSFRLFQTLSWLWSGDRNENLMIFVRCKWQLLDTRAAYDLKTFRLQCRSFIIKKSCLIDFIDQRSNLEQNSFPKIADKVCLVDVCVKVRCSALWAPFHFCWLVWSVTQTRARAVIPHVNWNRSPLFWCVINVKMF